jgi:hypothetical protein
MKKTIITFIIFLFGNVLMAQIELTDKNLDSIVKHTLNIDIDDVITKDVALTLTNLEASSLQINDLTGISNFKNLKNLYLSSNNISEISEIAILPNLEFVSLRNNKILDVLPLLISLSESVEIDVSQNCINNFEVVQRNLINSIRFIGGNNQNSECNTIPTFLDQFDVISTDISTKEVKFLFRGYHPTLQSGNLNFGNGETVSVTLNGFTQELTYNYSSNDDFTATLSLNDKTLTATVGFAINPLILIQPINNTSNTIEVWVSEVFNWQTVSNALKYELNILKDNIKIAGKTVETNELDFNIFNLEENGEYEWKVRALNNNSIGSWSETFTFSITEALSTDDFNSNEITVYPNPIKDFLIIKAENFEMVTVFDITGKILNIFTSKNVDLRNLNSGIYILKIKDNKNRVKTLKIVKQ